MGWSQMGEGGRCKVSENKSGNPELQEIKMVLINTIPSSLDSEASVRHTKDRWVHFSYVISELTSVQM